jgi:hypothetical protein
VATVELNQAQLNITVDCLETVKQDIKANVLYGLIEGPEVRQRHIDAIQSAIDALCNKQPATGGMECG